MKNLKIYLIEKWKRTGLWQKGSLIGMFLGIIYTIIYWIAVFIDIDLIISPQIFHPFTILMYPVFFLGLEPLLFLMDWLEICSGLSCVDPLIIIGPFLSLFFLTIIGGLIGFILKLKKKD